MGRRNGLIITVFVGIFAVLFAAFCTPAYASVDVYVNTPENPVLEVSLSSNSVQLDLNPKPGASSFGTASLTASAGTNNLTGYTMYMTIGSADLARTEALANGNTPTIKSLSESQEGYAENNFTNNRWGYRIGSSGNYFAIPSGNIALSSSSERVNQESTTITFASKVNMSQPAGSYTTSVNIIALVNDPPVSLQDIDTWRGSLTTGQTTLAKDDRDNRYYHVGKMADGRIWMLDNLALDLTNSTTLNGMTSLNTNATSTALTALKSGNRSAGAQYATAGVTNWTSGHNYSIPSVNMVSKDIVPSGTPANSVGYNKIGGYYNFCAASAGSYCYGNDTTSGSPSGDAIEDICPAGWKIPSSAESTGEFQALTTAITGSDEEHISDSSTVNLFRTTFSAPLSGAFINGSTDWQGEYGDLWSSTKEGHSMVVFEFGDDMIYPAMDGYELSDGYSIRCIAKRPAATITFNANGGEGTMSRQILSDGSGTLNTSTFTREDYIFVGWNTDLDVHSVKYSDETNYTGGSVTLYAQWAKDIREYDVNECPTFGPNGGDLVIDTRNSRVYNVSTNDDDVCWMAQNLILESGTVLTNEDTALKNVTEYTIPATNDDHFSGAVTHINEEGVEGLYYDYCAASAGVSCYEEAQLYGYEDSICPLNWRLPTRQEAINEVVFPTLDTYNMPLKGYYDDSNSQLMEYADSGYWWVYATPPEILILGLNNNDIVNDFNLNNGASIRCVRSRNDP